MKRLSLIAVGVTCLLFQNAQAQLLQEGFGYTVGSYLGNDSPWQGDVTNRLSITSGNLTYSSGGYQLTDLGSQQLYYNGAGVGAAFARVDTNTFSASGITSGSLYYSFLIECTTLSGGNNYITSITPGNAPSGNSDPLTIYAGTTGTGWKIGLRHSGVTTGATYAGTTLALNTIYLVVAQYQFVAGSANDIVNLYLNPVPGGTQPVTPDASQSTGTAPVDATSLNDIAFRIGQTTTGGNYIIDNLLVGTSWGDVTPVVPEPASMALLGFGLLGMAMGYRRMRR
jgi:hypothetical protein